MTTISKHRLTRTVKAMRPHTKDGYATGQQISLVEYHREKRHPTKGWQAVQGTFRQEIALSDDTPGRVTHRPTTANWEFLSDD